jgi:hypothetical protein
MPESPPDPASAPVQHTGGRRNGIAIGVGLGVLVLLFYLVEASLRHSPWLFTDELEWSQLSRAIASTGHAARRGEPHFFESLYSYLIAPAWWITRLRRRIRGQVHQRGRHVPHGCAAYLLAGCSSPQLGGRVSLLSIGSRRWARGLDRARVARLLWFTAAALFAVRLFAAPSIGRAVPAILLAVGGIWVRSEFVALPAILALGAAIEWVIGRADQGIRWRRVALAAGGLVVFAVAFDLVVVQHVQSWSFGQYFNHHTLRQGSLASGALAIGLGFLPVIGGIASLWLPERAADPAYRAFAVSGASSSRLICRREVTYLVATSRS